MAKIKEKVIVNNYYGKIFFGTVIIYLHYCCQRLFLDKLQYFDILEEKNLNMCLNFVVSFKLKSFKTKINFKERHIRNEIN